MKTLKQVSISLVLSVLLANVSMANDYNPIIKIANKKIYLSLNDVAKQTSVRILDGQGDTLIEEKVSASKHFESVINLEVFPRGSYQLIIQSAGQETIKQFTLDRGGVQMESVQALKYAPVISSQKRGNLQLSLLNPNNGTVNMVIFDNKGQRCYQKNFENQKVIDANLNVKQLPAGFYTVVIDNTDEVYTKQVRLK